jgi:hypothetical protein
MISHNAINANGFIFCSVYQGPNETTIYFNDGEGQYHQQIYIVEGDIDTYPSDTEVLATDAVNAPLVSGVLYDISNTKGKYVIGKTDDTGASMVMFNPVPLDRQLNIEILKDAQTKQITATDKKVTIVCLTGPVLVNDKEVGSMKFVRLYPGKSATLTLDESNICAIVS